MFFMGLLQRGKNSWHISPNQRGFGIKRLRFKWAAKTQLAAPLEVGKHLNGLIMYHWWPHGSCSINSYFVLHARKVPLQGVMGVFVAVGGNSHCHNGGHCTNMCCPSWLVTWPAAPYHGFGLTGKIWPCWACVCVCVSVQCQRDLFLFSRFCIFVNDTVVMDGNPSRPGLRIRLC